MRLDRLRAEEDCRALLASLDSLELLSEQESKRFDPVTTLDDDELLAELEGILANSDITELRHVRSQVEVRASEEIANREKCKDFAQFQPLFEQVDRQLKSGDRQTRPFGKDASINTGNFFILGATCLRG